MDPSRSIDQGTRTVASRISSPTTLLAQGLDYFRQGKHVEGISLCALAREGLSPEQMYFAAAIDAFLESHAHYRQAEEAFHEASRKFVEAENKQQTLLLTVQKLLQATKESIMPISSQLDSPTQEPGDQQGLRAANAKQAIPPQYNGNQAPQLFDVPPEYQGMLPALSITFFGHFEVRRQDQPLELCQNRNGQAIFRYLLAQPAYRATTDKLMALLWPQDEAEVARHKVQVAVSALRRSLHQQSGCPPGEGYILCKNGIYQVNPAVSISSDVEQFLALYRQGRQGYDGEAMTCFEQACRLYAGPFLMEDLYADWSLARREQLSQHFMTMCRALSNYQLQAGRYEEAAQWARVLLAENCCDEDAHRQLITIYIAQGRRSEAIRQYQLCKRILVEELGLPLVTETITSLSRILFSEYPLVQEASINAENQENPIVSTSTSIERK